MPAGIEQWALVDASIRGSCSRLVYTNEGRLLFSQNTLFRLPRDWADHDGSAPPDIFKPSSVHLPPCTLLADTSRGSPRNVVYLSSFNEFRELVTTGSN
ncbi:hypothetical protein FA13DRAFT_833844 [Coprinellus micaceus]|uniref:Uncharacterized protein n=1 Tax=Coprinellus micaceus TaxID=71717 RepID=A0A4Y7S2Z6_COPMI|nr:hypothetical protein FA13DRAFT_833844 [Coprinellus micaceus]